MKALDNASESFPYFPCSTIVPFSLLAVLQDWPVSSDRKRRPTTLEQAFGQVIFSHREEKGLSQMDLAVAAGYSLRYIGDVERGTKSATMRTMKDIATLLKISLGTLVLEAEALLAENGGFARQPTGRAKKSN